ncbi:hypothetical protein [Neptuniibacter sp. QD37_11]|uniref:hypothetical protein n=1 Tax=Neptuniibacter sp. QD37_11 TaxID=3398209 RepID=UPI0039F59202
MDNKALEKLHLASLSQSKELSESKLCGCYYCIVSMSADKVSDWKNSAAKTGPVCPNCGTNSIIGDELGQSITDELLSAMNTRYFS